MSGALRPRPRETLAAVTRTLVPSGGTLPAADDIGLVEAVTAEVEGYPPRALRRTRLLLFAIEYFPLLDRRWRRFSAMGAEQQHAYLEFAGHHRRSPLRRLVVSYLKQIVYANYLSQPSVEAAVGYRYECARPRDGIAAMPEGQIHH